jgi:hypothetical protein
MDMKVKMFLSLLQKSKKLLGVNDQSDQSPVPENEIFSHSVEHSGKTPNINCLSALSEEELLKRNEELKEIIYGKVLIDSLMYHV